MPTTATPAQPGWKQEDEPEGPDELELAEEDLIVTGLQDLPEMRPRKA